MTHASATRTHAGTGQLWRAATAGEVDVACEVVAGLLRAGVTGSDIITDVLAPVQRAVGRDWYEGRRTVREEHAATAVVDAALTLIEAAVPPPRGDGVRLAVAGAQGEWHVLASRFVAQLARERGYEVHFLGPAPVSDPLREHLLRLRPEALLLSATTPLTLDGAGRSIQAAHDASVPVVAGGAALGRDGLRAAVLQADAWCDDVQALCVPVPRRTAGARQAQPQWRLHQDVLLAREQAVSACREELPHTDPARLSASDLNDVVDHAAASLLVRDPRVLRDYTLWAMSLVRGQGKAQAPLRGAYAALARELPRPAAALLVSMAELLPEDPPRHGP